MIRTKRLGVLVAALGLAQTVAAPAHAQFGSIFGGPPRPPAEVPQEQSDPRYPPPEMDRDPRLPPIEVERDPWYGSREPAPEPPPPPLTRLPSVPRPGDVRSQPLPPPPGVAPAPAPPPPATAAPSGTPPSDTAPDVAARPPPGGWPGKPPLIGLPPGQRQPRGTPQPGNGAPPDDEVVVAPPSQKIVNSTAVFSGLDKITGRIISFDVAIDEMVQFGALRLTPRACYTRPPTETPNTDGFVEVDEITLKGEVKRIFTGWMFAASPGLHGIEHPIYDVWLTDCKSGKPTVASANSETTEQQAEAPRSAPGTVPVPPQRPAQAPTLRR